MDVSGLPVQERHALLTMLMQDKEIGAYVKAKADAERAEYEANWKPPVWNGSVDWSQAPEWAKWWACDKYSNYGQSRGAWWSHQPEIGFLQGGGYWGATGYGNCADAPEFGFPLDTLDSRDFWQTSLTKRPGT